MQKVRFLKDFESLTKDTFRVVMGETSDYYYIQLDLCSYEVFGIHKCLNGDVYQVIERS